MRKSTAAAGTAVFLVVVPGFVAGMAPWWLTGWRAGRPYPVPLSVIGGIGVAAGIVVLIHAFARFVIEGTGTPAPIAPPERVVVGGLYRYVRNPMYLAVLAVIAGQALLLSRPVLFAYAAAAGGTFAAWVRWYEEPTLLRQHGARYEAYRREVPAWWPRRPRRPRGQPRGGVRDR